jgi:methylthioribose-1-phosphate isomerase
MHTVAWFGDHVSLLDQTRLPLEETYLELRDHRALALAIKTMKVRGAPALGVSGAFGMLLAARENASLPLPAFLDTLDRAGDELVSTRPTAVNLAWGVAQMRTLARSASTVAEAIAAVTAGAQQLCDDDVAACRAMGRHGAALLPATVSILTRCNAGALATAGYGSALGVVRAAVEAGKAVRVFADETRPLLQGARLTAWELQRDGIPTTLIADTMAGYLMRRGEIDCVIVGADRIAANGDVANKIGTYQVAVLAKENGLPFYVAAPLSTVDLATPNGDVIVIEERSPDEVTNFGGTRIAPAGISVRNPAFDVTPARYVSAVITERGVARAPYGESLAALAHGAQAAGV